MSFEEWLRANFTEEQIKVILENTYYHDYYMAIYEQLAQLGYLQGKEVTVETGQPKFNLPEYIDYQERRIPLDYYRITEVGVTIDEPDPETGKPTPVQHTMSIYAPIPYYEEIKPEMIDMLYRNMYGVLETGEVYQEGMPLTPQQLGNIIPYDPLRDTGELEEFTNLIIQASMLDFARREYGEPTPEMIDVIDKYAKYWVSGGKIMPEGLLDEFKKSIEQKVPKEPPPEPLTEAQAAGMRGIAPTREMAENEYQHLKNLTGTYQKYAEQYKQMQTELEMDDAEFSSRYPTEFTTIKAYEKWMADLQALETPGRQFDIGGRRRDWAGIANQLGVSIEQAVSMGKEYFKNPNAPRWATVSEADKATLYEIGKGNMGIWPTPEYRPEGAPTPAAMGVTGAGEPNKLLRRQQENIAQKRKEEWEALQKRARTYRFEKQFKVAV